MSSKTVILSAPGPQGPTGPAGPAGATGPAGPAGSDAVTPDATSLVKGKVQLAGDLGGTAGAPTVPVLLSTRMRPMLPRTPTAEVPTITWAATTGYSGEKSIAWNHADSLGLIDRGAKLEASGAWGVNNPAVTGAFINAFALEFWHNGQDVALGLLAPGSGQLETRVFVDGHLVQDWTAKPFVSGDVYMKLAFGSVKTRLIRVVVGNAWYLGLRLPSTGYAYANTDPSRFKAAIIGDSLTQALTSGASGEILFASGIPQQISHLTGWDVYQCGIGGTGWVKDSVGGGHTFGSVGRIAQVATHPADLYIFAGSVNDMTNGYTVEQVNTAMTAGLDALSALKPGVPIIISGVQTANVVAGTVAAYSAAMKANALAHPAVKGYIDWTLPAFWLKGTGNSGTPNGTGNADLFFGPDSLHPTRAGAEYMARRTVAELARIKV